MLLFPSLDIGLQLNHNFRTYHNLLTWRRGLVHYWSWRATKECALLSENLNAKIQLSCSAQNKFILTLGILLFHC